MFIPRALRLKGIKEKTNPRGEPPTKKVRTDDKTKTSRSIVDSSGNGTKPQSGPRFVTRPVTPEYLGFLVDGMELMFSDYAHQDKKQAGWLQEHYRDVEDEGKFVHLSAILEHSTISTLKPEATQILIQQALKEHPSDCLELSQNGYYIRRRPSTYPLRFIPQNSFELVDDNGLSFWDQRTIYVEPHTRDLCKTPARVAYWLKEHGQMKEKWLPVQAVHTLYNSCAFVVLSGNVTHQDVWGKWRGLEQPEEWKILTKVEHTKRTDEYIKLQRKERGDKAAAPIFEASKKRQIVDMDTSEKSDSSRVAKSIRKPTRREMNEAEAQQGGRQGH